MERIYLDSAATNLVDPSVLGMAERFTGWYKDEKLTTRDVFDQQKASLGDARRAMAGFLGCGEDEIALMQSTSHCLGTLSQVLPLEKGDNVLVCDLEYQASVICWMVAQKRIGFEVREVVTHGGVVTADDFARYTDEHTRVILLAAVQEVNGYRADVKEICDFARAHGIISIIDGIQECGGRPVNVKELGMDIYCGGGKKWLGNPFACGYMYISKEMQKKIEPPYYSYYDMLVPEGFGSFQDYLEDPRRVPFDDYRMVQEASVFETGGFANFLGAMGLAEAVRLLTEIGMENVERHNLELNRYLYDELSALGFQMESPGDEKHMSTIVVFNFDGLKDGNVERERKLQRYLLSRNIFVTVRCSKGMGGIRVSFHHYTPKRYCEIFIDAVKDFLAEGN